MNYIILILETCQHFYIFTSQLEDLESADEFYGAMGRRLPQIQEGILINDTSLMSVSKKLLKEEIPNFVGQVTILYSSWR